MKSKINHVLETMFLNKLTILDDIFTKSWESGQGLGISEKTLIFYGQ